VVPPQYRNPSDPSRTGTVNGVGASDDTPSGPPGWLLYLPPVIGLLVLLRFAAGAMPVLARNRRRRK
jgi:phospholipid/cholesterol/gamma-HCH transport system substrate-binding protein